MTAATGRPNGNDSADDRRRELRETISAVALDLVLERGLDAVTVDEISRASNVSRRTFFNYFPSKVAACIPEMIPAQDEAIEQFLTDFSVPTMTALSRLLWLQVSNARRQSSAFDKFHDMWRREPGIRSEVHEILDRAEDRVAALVARREGRSPGSADAVTVAAASIAILRVAVERWRTDQSGAKLEHRIQEAFEAIARSVTLDAPDD